MRRRFGRRRGGRGSRDTRANAIDAERWLQRIVEERIVAARALQAVSSDDPAAGLAAIGRGETEDGEPIVVGFAPRSAGDAALATLAYAARLAAEEDFRGQAVAIAPEWSIAARRLLGLLGELPFRFRALAAPSLGEADARAELDVLADPVVVSPQQLALQPARLQDRELFGRAVAALEGLAAKHGGAIRGIDGVVELVVMARRVALLRVGDHGMVLESILPERASAPLVADDLAGAMDRLEGSLRKRLNDRRTREGEDGLRARAVSALATVGALRSVVRWPLGGADRDEVDLAGVDPDGATAVGAIRQQLGLADLRPILDATLALRPALATVFAEAEAPLRLGTPRLLLAAERFDEAVGRVLSLLTLGHALFELRTTRSHAIELAPLASGVQAAPAVRPAPEAETPPEARREPRPRRRGRAGPRDRDAESTAPARADGDEAPRTPVAKSRFEEVSLFELDDDAAPASGAEAESGARRRRRGRGRRRSRRPGSEGSEDAGPTTEAREPATASREPSAAREASESANRAAAPHGRRPRRADPRAEPAADDTLDDEAILDAADDLDLSGPLAALADDVSEVEEEPEVAYEDDGEVGDEADPERERRMRELEARRRARKAKAASEAKAEKAQRPRRAALVAHADRDSLAAVVMLAREVRVLEGIWVYPQSELMTFFRSVATDLREATPIYLVGFTASPARDTVQAASLYQGRLCWFDHHDWPPEDLEAMRQAVGPDALTVTPGVHSSMPAVLSICTRRSRFSDKFVDLITGRFSQHDYERWGRLWWWRLGEYAQKFGDRRADLEPLLAGRPSDLAREAATAPMAPPPPEVEFLSRRDFPLVHFGRYSLVVVPVPRDLDLHVACRIARERYGAQLSLGLFEGEELMILGGNESFDRRPLDLGSMVDHLASKMEWVEALPDSDHVARFRAHGIAREPGRLDDLVGEIAMGRSILEG